MGTVGVPMQGIWQKGGFRGGCAVGMVYRDGNTG